MSFSKWAALNNAKTYLVIDRFIQSISDFLLRLEARLGLFVTSLLLSLLLILTAMLYVQPVFRVVFHGVLFSDLSSPIFIQ